MINLLQQEANSGSTWGWLFLVKSQEQQVRLPCIQLLLYYAKLPCAGCFIYLCDSMLEELRAFTSGFNYNKLDIQTKTEILPTYSNQ